MRYRPDALYTMFPYGMSKNPDGSWTFFNRAYKTLGTITDDFSEWDDPQHKVFLSGLGKSTLAKLDTHGLCGSWGDKRVYFYNDQCSPEDSKQNMDAYLERLSILIRLRGKEH
jgi:hypothetical protein